MTDGESKGSSSSGTTGGGLSRLARSVVRGGALLFLANVIITGGKLGAMVVLSRLWDQDVYGTYRQVWLIANITVTMGTAGFRQSIPYFVPNVGDPQKLGLIARTTLVLMGIGTVVALGTIAASGPISRGFDNPPLAMLLVVFAFFTAVELPSMLFDVSMAALKRPRYVVYITGAFSLLRWGLVIGLALAGQPLTLIFGAVLVEAVLRLVTMTLIVRSILPVSPDLAASTTWREQLAFSLPLGFSMVIQRLSVKTDQIIISLLRTPERYAVYANGAFRMPTGSILVNAFNTMLAPTLSKLIHDGEHERARRLFRESAPRLAVVLIPVTIGMAAVAPELALVLYGPKYLESSIPLAILSVAVAARAPAYPAMLQALGLTRRVFIGAAIALVINVVLDLILLYYLDLAGAALATVISILFMHTYFLFTIARGLQVPVRRLLPWGRLAVVYVGAAVSYGATAGGRVLLGWDPTSAPVLGLLGWWAGYAVVFGIWVLVTRSVTREDMAALLAMVRDRRRRRSAPAEPAEENEEEPR